MTTSRVKSLLAAARARNNHWLAIAAIACVGLSYGMVMQTPRWAPMAYFTLTKALSNGTAQVDSDHWESGDLSWINGHYFSSKAPGLSVLTLPPYVVAKSLGGASLAKQAADHLRSEGIKTWDAKIPSRYFGFSTTRAKAETRSIANQALFVWLLGLFGTVIPAVGLMFLMRWVADFLQPGTGLPTALALGLSTLVFPFATQLFSHVLAALLLFGAFALGLRERQGTERWSMVFATGLLLGISVDVEYPTALAGLAIGLYVVLRSDAVSAGTSALLKRAGVLTAGGLIGVAPLLVYNAWAFGSPATISYHNQIAVLGRSGHDKLGLLSKGFWGITFPRLSNLMELLLTPRGLFMATPVLLVSAIGLWWLRQDGKRAEFRVSIGIIVLFLIYVAGSWWPIGGVVPGPRYLVPMLPFLCLGMPYAWKRIPAVTLALALAGSVVMFFATSTKPIVRGTSVDQWWNLAVKGNFSVTIWDFTGLPHGIWTVAPIALLVLLAVGCAALGQYGSGYGSDYRLGALALVVWLAVARFGAQLVGENVDDRTLPVDPLPLPILLLGFGAGLGGVLLMWALRRSGSRPSASGAHPAGIAKT